MTEKEKERECVRDGYDRERERERVCERWTMTEKEKERECVRDGQ